MEMSKMGDKASAVEGSGIFESLFGGFSNGLSIFNNNPFRRKSDASAEAEALGLTSEDIGSKSTTSNYGNEKGVRDSGVLDELTNVQKAEYRDFVVEEQLQGYPGVSPRAKLEGLTETKEKRVEGSRDEVEANQAKDDGENRKRKQNVGDSQVDTETSLHEVTSIESKKKSRKKVADGTPESGIRQSSRILKKRLNEEFQDGGSRKGRKFEKSSESHGLSTDGGSLSTGKRPPFLTTDEDNNNKRLKEGGKSTPRNDTEANVRVETRSGSKRKTGSEMDETDRRKRQDTLQKEGSSGNREESHGVVDSSEQPTGRRMPGSKADNKDEVTGQKKKKRAEDKSEGGDRLSRTIFVGNLPLNVKTKHLTREFSKFGAVESARLRSVPLVDTKLPRRAAVITGQLNQTRASVNGYVVFEDEKSAKAALAHNMHLFNEKHLRVDMASAPRQSGNSSEGGIEYDRARSIFVGNLPFDVEDEEVYSLFDSESPDLKVEAVRVVRDPKTSIGKGFAFVCFKKKAGATNALDNAEHIRLKSRQLRIIRFGFKSKQTRANEANNKMSARGNTSKSRPKPRPGAEQRLNKKGVFSFEGARSSKADGKPGKGASRVQLHQTAASGQRKSTSKPTARESKQPVKKRPAVAARKLASGPGKIEKRKKEEKGTKLDNARSKKRKVK